MKTYITIKDKSLLKKVFRGFAIITLAVLFQPNHMEAQYQVLRNLNYSTDGSNPMGPLTKVGNTLYGMTHLGGANYSGSIFSIGTDGNGFKVIRNFADTGSDGNADGGYPAGNNLISSGKKLFGITAEGGSHNVGNIFSIDTDGARYQDLWDFADTGFKGHANGAYPFCHLLQSGGKLFGMTQQGGSAGQGTLFSIDTNGKHYRDLWDFADTGVNGHSNGAYPFFNGLLLVDKRLYAFTTEGGSNGDGIFFAIDTDGANFKDLMDFEDSLTGQYPYSTPAYSNGKIFGTTGYGGEENEGTVFSIDTNGTNYKNFWYWPNDSGGEAPFGSVVLSGNILYGTAKEGGLYDNGVLFQIDTTGNNIAVIDTFNYEHGAEPYGDDMIISGGTLYGAVDRGGKNNYGVIYKMDLCYLMQVTHTVVDDTNGHCNGSASIIPSGGPTPYTYKWSGGQTTSSLSGMCAGSYYCDVTDANGCYVHEIVNVGNILQILQILGTDNITASSGTVKLYPNPNNGLFTVNMDNLNVNCEMTVFNNLGQEIYSSQLSPRNSSLSIDLSRQPSGIYFYQVVAQSGEIVKQDKIIIQK